VQRGSDLHQSGFARLLRPPVPGAHVRSTGALLDSCEAEAVYRDLAEGNSRVHIHAPVSPDRFVEVWSVYDVGLLPKVVCAQTT
jgi:hypothetical protein